MKTQDVADSNFKQVPIILIKGDIKMEIMNNPIYYPILASLREGPKTVKEIEEDSVRFLKKEAKKLGITDEKDVKDYVSKRKRSDKSLYRYIQHLIELNYVALWGKRVAMDKPMTEKLFARTAKFFFVEDYYEKMLCEEPNCIETMVELLSLIYDVPKLNEKELRSYLTLVKKSYQKITNILFKDKPEEFVHKLENLNVSEITSVIQALGIIELITQTKKTEKLRENLKK